MPTITMRVRGSEQLRRNLNRLHGAERRQAQRDGLEAGATHGLHKRAIAVEGTRGVAKRDMRLNDATPHIEVDPETYEVRADGQLLTCEPAAELPLAQRYFLF